LCDRFRTILRLIYHSGLRILEAVLGSAFEEFPSCFHPGRGHID
jgi:hypothetical protein